MRLTHVNISMPEGSEAKARAFYGELLGLIEVPKPESIRGRGGVWFDAGGLHIHLSVEKENPVAPPCGHFGLACTDVSALRNRLEKEGVRIEEGRPMPWQRFFVQDPFGNRVEIHEEGVLGQARATD